MEVGRSAQANPYLERLVKKVKKEGEEKIVYKGLVELSVFLGGCER